jgi:hypothetical protein
LGDEPEGVLVAAEIEIEAGRPRHERVEATEGLGPQGAGAVEVAGCELAERGWRLGPRPEPHLAPSPVAQVHLAERRRPAARQCARGAGPAFEPRQGELDVFASAEGVGGEIRTRTEVLPGRTPADRHAVGGAALGVGDLELGEQRIRAKIPESEPLFTPELTPQRGLPGLQGHALGAMQSRELARTPRVRRRPETGRSARAHSATVAAVSASVDMPRLGGSVCQ